MSDPIIPGSKEDVNIQGQSELNLDNFGPKSQLRPATSHAVCKVCGFIFPKFDMVRYNREWYCRPNDCYNDITGIELVQNPESQFKNKSLGSRFWKGDGGHSL